LVSTREKHAGVNRGGRLPLEHFLQAIQRLEPVRLHLGALFRAWQLHVVHCYLAFSGAFGVEIYAHATLAAVPFCAQGFIFCGGGDFDLCAG
jgi:hypothetical protein